MKKINYALFCLVLFFALGCSSDSVKPASIVGIWKLQEDCYTIEGDKTYCMTPLKAEKNVDYKFDADGSMYIRVYDLQAAPIPFTGKIANYTIGSNNSFTLTWSNPGTVVYTGNIIKLDANNLIFQVVRPPVNGKTQTDKYTFIK